MPATFSQIYIQVVFAVQGRQNLIQQSWKTELHKYLAGIITAKQQKSIIVNGMPDLVRDVKNNSAKFINERGFVKGKFAWQEGFGAFSYSRSHIDRVYQYILNQEEHHKKKSFRTEYIELLNAFEIPYDEKYLFEWYE